MAIFRVPMTDRESNFEQQVTLDGVSYTLRFLWNARVQRYFVDLEEQDGTRVATGRKVVADVPMFYRDTLDTLPEGDLWTITIEPTLGVDPGLRAFNVEAFIGYVS